MGQGRYWVDTRTLGLTGLWDIGEMGGLSNVQFKSISSWRKVEQIADEDLDGTAGEILFRVQPDFNETTQVSQEFQFNGSALDERLFFSTGIYYFREKTPHDDLIRTAGISRPTIITPMANSPSGSQYLWTLLEPTFERLKTDNESYSWYGQLDFDVTSQIQVTAGLRYTNEKRWSEYTKLYALYESIVPGSDAPGLNGNSPNPTLDNFGGACSFQCTIRSWFPGRANIMDWEFQPEDGRVKSLSTRDEAFTPMVSIKYQLHDQLLDNFNVDSAMLYATYSEGFHSGGVTAGAIDLDITGPGTAGLRAMEDPVTFKPEKVKNYEVGLKLQAFDQRIQANMAMFYMDYSWQPSTATPGPSYRNTLTP